MESNMDSLGTKLRIPGLLANGVIARSRLARMDDGSSRLRAAGLSTVH
jgi:hypothetical protein